MIFHLGTKVAEKLAQLAAGASLSKLGGSDQGDSDVPESSQEETPEDPGLTISADFHNAQTNGHADNSEAQLPSQSANQTQAEAANEQSGDKATVTNEKPCENGHSNGVVEAQPVS